MEATIRPLIEKLSYQELAQLCSASRQWETLCQLPEIWQILYQRDFGLNISSPQLIFDWKTEYLLKQSGKVWAFGFNEFGNLGIGSNFSPSPPTLIPHSGIIQVTPGEKFTLFLDSSGKVWISGISPVTLIETLSPVFFPIPSEFPILKVAAGSNHALFLDSNGQVWAFGENQDGKLGLGDNRPREIPEIISNLPPISDISAEHKSSAFLDNQNRAWVCGNPNVLGEYLEDPFQHDLSSPVQLTLKNVQQIISGPIYYAIILSENRQEKYLVNLSEPADSEENSIFLAPADWSMQVALCSQLSEFNHAFVLIGNNIFGKGQNSAEQLGLPAGYFQFNNYVPIQNLTESGEIREIAVGEEHSLILYKNGQVFGLGQNDLGQIGLINPINPINPILPESSRQNIVLPSKYFPRAISAGLNSSFILTQTELKITPAFYQKYSQFFTPISPKLPNVYSDPRGYIFRVV